MSTNNQNYVYKLKHKKEFKNEEIKFNHILFKEYALVEGHKDYNMEDELVSQLDFDKLFNFYVLNYEYLEKSLLDLILDELLHNRILLRIVLTPQELNMIRRKSSEKFELILKCYKLKKINKNTFWKLFKLFGYRKGYGLLLENILNIKDERFCLEYLEGYINKMLDIKSKNNKVNDWKDYVNYVYGKLKTFIDENEGSLEDLKKMLIASQNDRNIFNEWCRKNLDLCLRINPKKEFRSTNLMSSCDFDSYKDMKVDYLIEDYIEKSSTTIISGIGKSGKTTIALSMLKHMVMEHSNYLWPSALEHLRFKCEGGNRAYVIQGENSLITMAQRINTLGLPGMNILFNNNPSMIEDDEFFLEIFRVLIGGFDIVMLDPLYALTMVDMKDSTPMGIIRKRLDIIRKLSNAAIILIHHSVKLPQDNSPRANTFGDSFTDNWRENSIIVNQKPRKRMGTNKVLSDTRFVVDPLNCSGREMELTSSHRNRDRLRVELTYNFDALDGIITNIQEG